MDVFKFDRLFWKKQKDNPAPFSLTVCLDCLPGTIALISLYLSKIYIKAVLKDILAFLKDRPVLIAYTFTKHKLQFVNGIILKTHFFQFQFHFFGFY